ncbi:AraC family transcriptional activator of pobA [Pedobacter sp. CAN_A7]|uniref:helix-turn-helix domain-containing protein n=1 Tax=Pedobacter sp. CAN_A7 TaxID=2787722 RepID=UPI0018CA2D3F
MSQKQYFNGLYGSNAIEFERGLINIYPFGVIGKQYNGAVKVHAHHNLLQLFLINSGTTELRVNDEAVTVTGPCFIIIPKNMAHGFNHLGDVNGWIISLSDIYIEHMVQTDVDILTAIDVFQVTPLNEEQPTTMAIYKAAQTCVDEYHSNLPGRILMMQTLVGQIMVNLFRQKDISTHREAAATDTSSALYFRRFKQNIKSSYSYKKTVNQYAEDLKITSGYLNNICKSVSNQSPKDIIIDYFLIEARFLLLDPEKSINQVCYLLQFEDPAYFTRLFKKRTGTTPKEFRNSTGIKNSLINKAVY